MVSKRHLLDERINMRIEMKKVEFLDKLKALYMEKIQLEERLDVCSVNIQRHIGGLEGFEQSKSIVAEIAAEADEDLT